MSAFLHNLKPILLRLGSMPLAITLLVVLALASVIGTVLLQNQEQNDYLQQFGPVWYWVFRSLGLFDMYHTWWFLTLLGALMVSLSVCLWRNVPRMLKEMRSRKITLSDNAMKHMQHVQHIDVKGGDAQAIADTAAASLKGWETLHDAAGETIYVRADKGRFHKWGYILVHSAILIILIGGWMSVHFGFRGNMAVPEGEKAGEISFTQGTGTGHLKMPFEVRCNSFTIDFYPTGMPKEFRSNLTIIDNGKEALTSDIIVNKPIYYKGVRIYQASFGDGGSSVKLKLFRMDGSHKVDTIESRVYDTYTDKETGVTMQFTGFRGHNIENMAEAGKPKNYEDLGPSVDFILRGPGLKPVKIRSFLNPFYMNGENRGSFMQVSLSGDDKEFQPFPLWVDFSNPKEWNLYEAFIGHLQKADLSRPQANLNAFKAALKDVYGNERPDNLQQIGMRTLQGVQTLSQLPWPFIPVLDDYEQVYYTGLQLTQDPGMNVVWIGSALLVIGLCIMFYVSHRKLWLVVRPRGSGIRLSVAGLSNRNPMVFTREFNELLSSIDHDVRALNEGGNA
jgi:cytochrome c biogenesis protein